MMLRCTLCLLLMTSLLLMPAPRVVMGEEPDANPPWRRYVRSCLDTLIEHGTDRYGEQHTPLLMAVLDVNSHESPEFPLPLDSLVRLEGRLHRRAERGSNFWYDQATLRAMYRMSELTDEAKYQQAADAYADYALKHCRKPDDGKTVYRNGLPAWGSHIFWDCYLDQPGGDDEGSGPHEILVYHPEWSELHRVNPQAVQQIIDGIWKWHIADKKTGLHNRHDDGRPGCDFAFSGGTFVQAFAFMYGAAQEQRYLDQAKTVANWHWSQRHPETGLVADAPGLTSRYDGQHCFTTVAGPHAAQLLRASELSGDPFFRDCAIAYIKAYDQYAWDEAAQTYHAMLKLDGTPVGDRPKGSGYDAWAPYGHIEIWRSTIFSYEFALSAAQAAVKAYQATEADGQAGDAELLAIARRWAGVIERNLPPSPGHRWRTELEKAMPNVLNTGGVYAEDYGRSISFFVHMYQATGEEKYLELAEQLGAEAVAKLYKNGLFRGHPAKPYYESVNGVGLLLFALLELDAPEEQLQGAF